MTLASAERAAGRPCGLLALLVLAGCAGAPAAPPEASAETWSVTAWGDRFEVFPEVEVLVAGEVATAHTHVTRLSDFAPVADARVEIVLVGTGGERVFAAERPDRPGIFAIEVTPDRPGEAELLFRIHDAQGSEEIRGGTVRIGTPESPGRPLRAPAPRGATDGGEPVSFLKEQQWKSAFATAWVRDGRLAGSVAGLATFRPPAGGESTVTAPMDGVVQPPNGSTGWPFVGLRVERGTPLFRVVPLVAQERSLATLEAELSTLATELETARARRGRLEELLALDATSEREVAEASLRVETLEARRLAAERDLESARAARQGGSTGGGLELTAPFGGEVAAVGATPGATVTAGEALARVVRTDVVWVEVAVPSPGARRLAASGVRGLVVEDPESGPVRVEEGLALVSVAPELSPRTGTVAVLLEAPSLAGFPLGSSAAAQILSAEERQGIVVPASALVDDGGVTVVYLQLAGETFVRQEVSVLERQGDRVLVDHLVPGQRAVTRGGDAIRRSSLLSTGTSHGHIH